MLRERGIYLTYAAPLASLLRGRWPRVARSEGVSSVEWYWVPISDSPCARRSGHPLSLAFLAAPPEGEPRGGAFIRERTIFLTKADKHE